MFGVKNLKLVSEDISSEEIGWYRTNKYWLDENNFVWKSVQNISPILPEIYIEITKKPSKTKIGRSFLRKRIRY